MTQNDTKKTNLKKTTKKIGEKQQTNSLELSKTKFSQKNDHWNHILEFLDYKKVVSCKQISKYSWINLYLVIQSGRREIYLTYLTKWMHSLLILIDQTDQTKCSKWTKVWRSKSSTFNWLMKKECHSILTFKSIQLVD